MLNHIKFSRLFHTGLSTYQPTSTNDLIDALQRHPLLQLKMLISGNQSGKHVHVSPVIITTIDTSITAITLNC